VLVIVRMAEASSVADDRVVTAKGADLSRLMPEHNLFNWIDGVGMFLLLGLGGISTLRRDIW